MQNCISLNKLANCNQFGSLAVLNNTGAELQPIYHKFSLAVFPLYIGENCNTEVMNKTRTGKKGEI